MSQTETIFDLRPTDSRASLWFWTAPLARPPAPMTPTLISSETCAQAKLVPREAKVAAAPMAAVEPLRTLRRDTPVDFVVFTLPLSDCMTVSFPSPSGDWPRTGFGFADVPAGRGEPTLRGGAISSVSRVGKSSAECVGRTLPPRADAQWEYSREGRAFFGGGIRVVAFGER